MFDSEYDKQLESAKNEIIYRMGALFPNKTIPEIRVLFEEVYNITLDQLMKSNDIQGRETAVSKCLDVLYPEADEATKERLTIYLLKQFVMESL